MPYRNKTYVCFDGDTDISYYRLMKAWHQNDRSSFWFYDAHDINTARGSSQEHSIKRQLRERLANSSVFVVLIGANTRYLLKFVRWEMEQAVDLGLPMIGVNLNGLRYQDPERCPPMLRDQLSLHIGFHSKILQYALENWPDHYRQLRMQRLSGPYFYNSGVYANLGLS